jgi:hypothetical protein
MFFFFFLIVHAYGKGFVYWYQAYANETNKTRISYHFGKLRQKKIA